MYLYRILILLLVITLSACKNDLATPKLDIEGHWIVDHGFFGNECKITSTITEKQMLLSFHSTVEDACIPEVFGLDAYVLPLDIVRRKDFLDESGALSVTLSVEAPKYSVSGSLTLTETKDGMSGVILDAKDPGGNLEVLVNKPYPLTRVAEDWLPIVKGTWGIWYSDGPEGVSTTDPIKLIAIDSLTSARMFAYGPLSAVRPEGALTTSTDISIATFSIKNYEKTKAGGYTLDVMYVTDVEPENPRNVIFEFTDAKEGTTLKMTFVGNSIGTVEMAKID